MQMIGVADATSLSTNPVKVLIFLARVADWIGFKLKKCTAST